MYKCIIPSESKENLLTWYTENTTWYNFIKIYEKAQIVIQVD